MNTSTLDAPVVERSNRLKATKLNNKMVSDYREDLFRAKENGKLVRWYEGVAFNPIPQTADLAWRHGSAAAFMIARNEEGPAREAAEGRSVRYERLLDSKVEGEVDPPMAAGMACVPACAKKNRAHHLQDAQPRGGFRRTLNIERKQP